MKILLSYKSPWKTGLITENLEENSEQKHFELKDKISKVNVAQSIPSKKRFKM
jgi:hypothetical protein